MDISFSDEPLSLESFSDEPEIWSEAIVIERDSESGMARRLDGRLHFFGNQHLCRNRTYPENTREGDPIWINERTGGISAHRPDMRSPRQKMRAVLDAQVKTLSDAIDAQCVDEYFK